MKLRANLSFDPHDELMGRILLLGASLCDGSSDAEIGQLSKRLISVLDGHLDQSGLHRTRNAARQSELLVELITLRQALSTRDREEGIRLGERVDRMLVALSGLALSTGEPGYFNGCGQLSADLLLATQMQGSHRQTGNALTGGYGRISLGNSVLVMDSGLVPDTAFAENSHASALAFEFSHDKTLLVGNCGPAPAELQEHRDAFRQAVAHSAPAIDGHGAAKIGRDGVLYPTGDRPEISVGTSDAEITATTHGFRSRFGVDIERHVSFISDGQSLVGRDRLRQTGIRVPSGRLSLSFHLGPNIQVDSSDELGPVLLTTREGQAWHFLWEGAELRVDESVRQSAHFGFHRTQQLILSADVRPDVEIAWIFTRQAR